MVTPLRNSEGLSLEMIQVAKGMNVVRVYPENAAFEGTL